MLDAYRLLASFAFLSLILEAFVAQQTTSREPKSYRVSILPLSPSIKLNSPYYAECRVEPQPPKGVEFAWYFNGRFHSEGERLSIPELKEYNVGEYTCQANIHTSSGTPLIAKTRALIQYQPISPEHAGQVQVSIVPLTQQMEQGRAFYADGRITPRPSVPVEYTWYFKDRVFSRGERLSIPELNEYWFGDYTCQASFRPTGGLPVEANATISLRFNPSASVDRSAPQTYWVSIDSLTERPARGSPYYADCRLQPQPPYPVRLTWYFKGRFHSEGQRLSIRELNEYTTGEYTCQAMVSPPSGTPLIINATKPIYYAAVPSPDVAGRIQVSIVPLTQQVERNKPFYAECRLSPRPSVPVDYTWYFQGRAFSRGERLSIRELNENTVGDYICLARFRPVGGSDAEMKATISILFNSSPSSGRNDQQTYVVSIDPLTRRPTQRAPYYADCRIQPRPPYPLRFTWYFKGRYHSDGQRLSISELNSYTTGEYICQVTITPPTGSPLVANATRSIYYNSVLPPGGADHQTYWVSIDPLTQRIEPGAPYYAECRIQPRPRYPVRFNWYFKERHHSQGERLSIPELNEYTTGEYTCQAAIERPSGSPLLVNATRTVNYNNPSPGDSGNFVLSVVRHTEKMEHNRPFYADCRLSPRPSVPVDYTWYFQGRVFSRGERLSIRELNEYTVGDYTCQARFRPTGGSTVEAKATIFLRLDSSPSDGRTAYWVSINPLTERPARGSPYYADCRLQPQPPYPVRLTWYFKGRYHSEGQRLSIRELNEYTSGAYTCQATITPPTGTPVTVNVTKPIYYAAVPSPDVTGRIQVSIVPLTQQVEQGRPFYADCRITPLPNAPVDYTWYFQGRIFSRGERLSIPELSVNTIGDYMCEARFKPTSGSTVEAKATISLQYNTPLPGGPTDQQTYWVIIDPLTGRPTQRAPYYADCRIQPRPPYPLRYTWYFKGSYHSDGQRLTISELNDYTIGDYTCQVTITPPTGSPQVANATKAIYYSSALPPAGTDHDTYWVSIEPLTQSIEYRAPYYAECRIQPRPPYPARFTWYFKGHYHSQGERLSIPELNEYTTGEYTCQTTIERPFGSPLLVNATRTIYYSNPLPGRTQLSIVPLTQPMEHKKPFYAECRLSPRPSVPVDYTWYFQGRVFSRGERLSIRELNENTVGDYICQARFRPEGGSDVEMKATISLWFTPPSPDCCGDPQTYQLSINSLTERPTRGSPFYADCRLQPQPSYPVRLTWYFKGRYHSEGQRLSIRELNEYTSGAYTCQATISPPSGTPLTINATKPIYYAAVPSPDVTGRVQVSIVPLTQKIEQRRPFYADCRLSPRPSVPVDYTWYFQGRVFSRGERLSIRELNDYTMGDYTCQARFRSAGGSTVEAKATISLWHSSPLSVVRTEPDRTRVNIVWRTERMEYNQPFYADCNVSPPPPTPVQYTWYIRGRAYSNGERLMIPKLTEHTAGNYTCQAKFVSTTGSPIEVQESLLVHYSQPVSADIQSDAANIHVIVQPLTRELEYRKPFKAVCLLQPPNPNPIQYTWYFKDRVFTHGEHLMIPDLNEDSVGEYICRVRVSMPSGKWQESYATIDLQYGSVHSGKYRGAQFTSPTPSFSTTIAPFHGPQLLVRRVALHLVRSGRCCQPNIPAPETGNNSV